MLKKTSRDLPARMERGFNESFESKCPCFEPAFWSILHFFSALAYFWDKSVKNHFWKGGDKLEIPKNPLPFLIFPVSILDGFVCKYVICSDLNIIGRAVIFMKHIASVFSLIFLPKTLSWNGLRFHDQVRPFLQSWL